MNSAQPKLTLIYVARNDHYMGNFQWRFATALNYLADNLVALNRLAEVEVLVTDWGSDIPLHTSLNLSPAAKRIVHFLIVPPYLARSAQKDSPFPIVIAQNAAVRRGRGEYIAQTDSDIMFTPDFLRRLFDAFEGRTPAQLPFDRALIFAKRRHIPWRYAAANPPSAELDWYLRHFGRLLPVEKFVKFNFAGTGMMIMHRDLWADCQGYDERLLYWGWMEIDLALRVKRKYPLLDLRKIGLTVFHLEHYPSRRPSNNPRKQNPTNWNNDFRPNGENWGLNSYPLEIFSYPIEPLAAKPPQLDHVHLNRRLLAVISQTLLIWLWHPIQSTFVVFFLMRRILYHAGVIWQLMKGKSINQWPSVIWAWHIERQQRQ